MEYAFGDITIACSDVERVMFPGDGITKGEVIACYRDVAELMVPELRGRPLTVVRYTKGIDRGGFYPVVDSAAGVVYLANQGAIELHIWTSRKDDLHRPDLLVFDLDPPEGPPAGRFDLARRAAGLVRELLE